MKRILGFYQRAKKGDNKIVAQIKKSHYNDNGCGSVELAKNSAEKCESKRKEDDIAYCEDMQIASDCHCGFKGKIESQRFALNSFNRIIETKSNDAVNDNKPLAAKGSRVKNSVFNVSRKRGNDKKDGVFDARGIKISTATNLIIMAVLIVLSAITFSGGYVFSAFGQKNNKAIYIGDTSKPQVSLMVNVYWGTEFIEPMLEVFAEYDVKTTFFVGGSWVEGNENIVKKIVDSGHELGNHGYFHKDHKKLNIDDNKKEIERCGTAVFSKTGITMNLFAPPSGAFSDATLNAAEQLGYRTIMWSKDTVDWRDKDAELIFKRAAQNPANGDLVLMHPTKCTLEALPNILQEIKKNGFSIVKVSENIG